MLNDHCIFNQNVVSVVVLTHRPNGCVTTTDYMDFHWQYQLLLFALRYFRPVSIEQ